MGFVVKTREFVDTTAGRYALTPKLRKKQEKASDLFTITLRYLSKSNLGDKIISSLVELEKDILFVVKFEAEERFNQISRSLYQFPKKVTHGNYRSKYKDVKRFKEGGILYWWSRDWTLTKSSGRWQTPAIALIHEMGHAYQYLILDLKNEMNSVREPEDPRYTRIENHNVKQHESVVASELNDAGFFEGVREDYLDNINIRMDGDTLKKVKELEEHYDLLLADISGAKPALARQKSWGPDKFAAWKRKMEKK